MHFFLLSLGIKWFLNLLCFLLSFFYINVCLFFVVKKKNSMCVFCVNHYLIRTLAPKTTSFLGVSFEHLFPDFFFFWCTILSLYIYFGVFCFLYIYQKNRWTPSQFLLHHIHHHHPNAQGRNIIFWVFSFSIVTCKRM